MHEIFARPFCETRCKKRKHKWGRRVPGNKAVAEMRCKKRKHKWGRRVPRREIKLLHKRIHRGGTPRPHLCLLSYALMPLCLPRQRLPGHATASALMFLEATRTIVRGRQPRSGLMCILCKLMSLCFRGKRLIHATSYVLMLLCSYVFRVSGCQGTLRCQPLCFLRPPGR